MPFAKQFKGLQRPSAIGPMGFMAIGTGSPWACMDKAFSPMGGGRCLGVTGITRFAMVTTGYSKVKGNPSQGPLYFLRVKVPQDPRGMDWSGPMGHHGYRYGAP